MVFAVNDLLALEAGDHLKAARHSLFPEMVSVRRLLMAWRSDKFFTQPLLRFKVPHHTMGVVCGWNLLFNSQAQTTLPLTKQLDINPLCGTMVSVSRQHATCSL